MLIINLKRQIVLPTLACKELNEIKIVSLSGAPKDAFIDVILYQLSLFTLKFLLYSEKLILGV